MNYYSHWISSALDIGACGVEEHNHVGGVGDLGKSWTYMPSEQVLTLLGDSIFNTLKLVGLASLILLLGAVRAASGNLSHLTQKLFRLLGAVPALVLALAGAAFIAVTFGSETAGSEANTVRLLVAAFVLALADASLSGTVDAVEQVVSAEKQQRYVEMGVLRGESVLSNMLPNIMPSLAGQFRARILNLISSAVVIEVILSVEGVGDLLWNATLDQDFGLVLGSTFIFVLLSSFLLFIQAIVEIVTALVVRKSPKGVVV
tara:strand:- start:224 stop:1003 length:780 start_codon:yes stop_codon:yes gene_type:complete